MFRIIIPARYQSSRLPGKVLLDIAGKSMLQHTYERALAANAQSVVIATDDLIRTPGITGILCRLKRREKIVDRAILLRPIVTTAAVEHERGTLHTGTRCPSAAAVRSVVVPSAVDIVDRHHVCGTVIAQVCVERVGPTVAVHTRRRTV